MAGNSNKTKIVVGAAAILILIVAGIGLLASGGKKEEKQTKAEQTGTKPEAEPKKETEIRLPDMLSELAYLAEEKGLFKEEGIKIKWTGQQAHGPANIVSITAGQNDAGMSITTAIINARATGSKIRLVATANPTGKKYPTITWLALENSGINSPEDFVGKKVTGASGTIAWYPVVEYLKKKGLSPDKVEFVTLQAPQQEQALRQGEVAAISTSQPFTDQILKNGGVKKILTDYEVLGIEHIGGWAFSEDFIDKNPEAVKGFVTALTKTVKWIRESEANRSEALQIIKKRNGKYLPLNWAEGDEKLLLTEKDITQWIDLLVDYGNIKKGQVKASEVYTNEFNPYSK